LIAALSASLAVAVAAYGWSHWGWSQWGWSRRGSAGGSTVHLVDRSHAVRNLLEREVRAAEREVHAATRADGARILRAGSFEMPLRKLDPEALRIYFPAIGESCLADDRMYLRRQPRVDTWFEMAEYPGGGYRIRTNALGMREDTEPAEQRPDLRVLVTGDSHTDGVCGNGASIPNALEALLAAQPGAGSVEVLNAGLGGTNPFYYLAVLERYAPELRPHAFVAIVYGGNDFSDALELERWMNRREPAKFSRRKPVGRVDGLNWSMGFLPQEAVQANYFANNLEEVPRCIRLLEALSAEIARVAEQAQCVALIAYLPPATRVEPLHTAENVAAVMQAFGLTEADLALSDRIADAWLARLAERGIAHVDLRPALKAEQQSCYWNSDSHLNLRGNQVIARELRAKLETLLEH
jgi:lysophospholipase L1-like esterase